MRTVEEYEVYSEGDDVKWAWGSGYGHGTIKSIFTHKTTRHIDGNEVVRHGSQDDPAYYIEVDDGNNVLKLHSEIEKE